MYSSKPSIIDKYMRRPSKLRGMCLIQFSKIYQSANDVPAKTKWTEYVSIGKGFVGEESTEERIRQDRHKNLKKFIITDHMTSGMTDEDLYKLALPKYIKLLNPLSVEPTYMSLRSFPLVIRLHKYRKNHDPLEYIYSELLLYKAFKDESEFLREDDKKCAELYME